MIAEVRLCACINVGACRRFVACVAGHGWRPGPPDLSAAQRGVDIEASNARRHSRQLRTDFRSKRRNSLTQGGEVPRHLREFLAVLRLRTCLRVSTRWRIERTLRANRI